MNLKLRSDPGIDDGFGNVIAPQPVAYARGPDSKGRMTAWKAIPLSMTVWKTTPQR